MSAQLRGVPSGRTLLRDENTPSRFLREARAAWLVLGGGVVLATITATVLSYIIADRQVVIGVTLVPVAILMVAAFLLLYRRDFRFRKPPRGRGAQEDFLDRRLAEFSESVLLLDVLERNDSGTPRRRDLESGNIPDLAVAEQGRAPRVVNLDLLFGQVTQIAHTDPNLAREMARLLEAAAAIEDLHRQTGQAHQQEGAPPAGPGVRGN